MFSTKHNVTKRSGTTNCTRSWHVLQERHKALVSALLTMSIDLEVQRANAALPCTALIAK